MNIEHKSVMTVKITYTEASEALKSYQKDMLSELWSSCANEYSNLDFMYLLLEGTNTSWFQYMIEKHGIPWIDDTGANQLTDFVEWYPNVFFSDDVLEQCDKDTEFFIGDYDSKGEYYGRALDTKKILSNI